jgi:hypothetical protein
MSPTNRERSCRARSKRRARKLLLAACAAVVLASSPALAEDDEYDPLRAGHPLRIAAYVVHPVGFALDWLFFRPVYWIGSHQPFRAIFGRTDAR